MDTDELMDARLREAGARWRATHTDTAHVDTDAVATAQRRGTWHLTALRWLVLGNAGKGGPGDRPGTAAISGVVWQLTGNESSGGTQRTPASSELFTIRKGEFVAIDDCTVLVGAAHADGSRLQVDRLVTRYRGCAGQTGPVPSATAAVTLAGSSTYVVSGTTLTISKSGAGTLTFTVAPPGTPVPTPDVATITGRSWQLRKVVEAGGRTRIGDLGAPLELRDDGTFTATDPCGTVSGTAAVAGNVLDFSNVSAHGHSCPPGAGIPTVYEMFSRSATWTIRGDVLTLTATGIGTLSYDVVPLNPQDPAQLAGHTWTLTQYERTSSGSSVGASAAATTVTVSFDGKGNYSSKHRCYTVAGKATLGTRNMRLSSTGLSDAIPCAQPRDPTPETAQNAAVDLILNGRLSWAVAGTTLTITKSGSGTLTYRRS